MYKWWIKIGIYILAFIVSLCGLSALDFNRFLKKNKPFQGQLLFYLISFAMAYLIGQFFINIVWILN